MFLFAIVFLIGGYFLGFYLKNSETKIIKPNKHQSGFTYISPLLECAISEPDSVKTRDLERKLRSFVDKKIKEDKITAASIYFHDLNSHAWLGINRSEKFSPASLLKVPLMIAVLKYAEDNKDFLQQEILVEDQYNVDVKPNIIPLKSVNAGEYYTVEELIGYAIHYSDNLAANMLIINTPNEYLDKVFLDIGILLPEEEVVENFMTVMNYASFFEILYNASYLNKEMSEYALSLLTHSSFPYGLSSGVPVGTAVAHKFGERVFENYKQLHDCGIIYKENNPYLLCVMTRANFTASNNNFNEMAAFIKDISLQVYNSL